jgi:DNA-binding MarR family transcriptional regulator
MPSISAEELAETALKIFPLMGRLMDSYMRVGGFPISMVHFEVMIMIQHQPMTVSDLAERQSISAASMSKTITVMEERGWVTRIRSQLDRRIVQIQITDTGRAVLASVSQKSHQLLQEAFEPLSVEERTTIQAGLEGLFRAFPVGNAHLLPAEE